MFYQSPNWKIEAEPIWRVPDTSLLNQFRWQTVYTPPIPVAGPPIPPTISAWTADSSVVTADSISFTCDGSDLINDGATPIAEIGNVPTYNVAVPLYTPILGIPTAPNPPLPVTSPPMIYYINGVPFKSGQ